MSKILLFLFAKFGNPSPNLILESLLLRTMDFWLGVIWPIANM